MLWSNLKRWLTHILKVGIQFDVTNIVLNDYSGTCKDLINTILLITKHYIHATKCMRKRIVFIDLAQKIYNMKELERNVTRRDNRLQYFNVKRANFDQ